MGTFSQPHEQAGLSPQCGQSDRRGAALRGGLTPPSAPSYRVQLIPPGFMATELPFLCKVSSFGPVPTPRSAQGISGAGGCSQWDASGLGNLREPGGVWGGAAPSPAVGNTQCENMALPVEQKLLRSFPVSCPSEISTKDGGGLCRRPSSALFNQGHLGQSPWASVVPSRKREQYPVHRVTEMKGNRLGESTWPSIGVEYRGC